MASDFQLLGLPHLAILSAVPLTAALMAWAARRSPDAARRIRLGLAVVLTANALAWYGYEAWYGHLRFPDNLPLQLCDLTAGLTVFAAFTLHPLVFELAYFAGLGGSGMALLTPDLWAPLTSYPSIRFFLEHGFVVTGVLFLAWAKQARPRSGCVRRVFVALNLYAAAIGAFNAAFGTNYFYLSRKPASFSILDFFGPWPFYLVAGEAAALLLLFLLWLPFRPRDCAGRRSSRLRVPADRRA